jgi:hypothetical protein
MDEMYWGQPYGAQRRHIFKARDDRTDVRSKSLCGGWRQHGHQDDHAVEPSDEYTEGEDCKACSRKAEIMPFRDVLEDFDAAMDKEVTAEYKTHGRYVVEYERGPSGALLSVWEMPDVEPSNERWTKVAHVRYDTPQECRESAASLESVDEVETFIQLHPHED